jgi:hypothetical protein
MGDIETFFSYLDAWDSGQPGISMPTVGETLKAVRQLRDKLAEVTRLRDTMPAKLRNHLAIAVEALEWYASMMHGLKGDVARDALARIRGK